MNLCSGVHNNKMKPRSVNTYHWINFFMNIFCNAYLPKSQETGKNMTLYKIQAVGVFSVVFINVGMFWGFFYRGNRLGVSSQGADWETKVMLMLSDTIRSQFVQVCPRGQGGGLSAPLLSPHTPDAHS